MCGISGIYFSNKISNLNLRIDNMLKSMHHRGPDAYSSYIYENIALAHNRLKIIDLSDDANMPMHSISRRYTLIFNGEIYNFAELKNRIKYNFTTKSDSEVILAYAELNKLDEFINNANGMFAIAIFDKETKSLTLYRDRLGIKPLYYYKDNNTFIFGSEIKAILSSGLVDAIENDSAFDSYLAYRYVPEPNTFFKNIFHIEAGTKMIVSSKNNNIAISANKYWELPKSNDNTDNVDPKTEQSILEETEEKLLKAVNYRTISDVPVGSYLSGGVDSSLLSAILSKKNSNLNTYTIGFENENYNEFKYSDIIAKQYKTKHHKILIENSNNYIDEWEKLISFRDQPLGVPNEIPLAIMSRKLKEKITVVLSGEGADELFGGYGKIFRFPHHHTNNDWADFVKTYEYVPREIRDEFLLSSKADRNSLDENVRSIFSSTSTEDAIFQFFHKFHIKGLLQRLDVTTMQASVEGRIPFLDHELIEYVYKNVPHSLKLKWNNEDLKNKAKNILPNDYSENYDTPKYILKKISEKYLPKEIIYRKKMGFPVPLNEWFDDSLTDYSKQLLASANWLNTKKIENLFEKAKKNDRFGQIIWMFTNIQLWKNKYFNKDWRY